MTLFPTRPTRDATLGSPHPAEPCHCDAPVLDDGGACCCRCGHFTHETIAQTWADQARRLENLPVLELAA